MIDVWIVYLGEKGEGVRWRERKGCEVEGRVRV